MKTTITIYDRDQYKKTDTFFILLIFIFFLAGIAVSIQTLSALLQSYILGVVLIYSLFMILQGIFTILLMVYAWNNPDEMKKNQSPSVYKPPHHSFTALIPARDEANVIHETLSAVANIHYPADLTEIIIICHTSDGPTIRKVEETIKRLNQHNIKLVLYNSQPISKTRGLNEGLVHASHEIVAVFDAEDEPHRDIYRIINTVLIRDKADVVQSGVQLMNYRSTWFSALNVLEYFFWFKSALTFFSKIGVVPLGGNTVFFRKKWLKKIAGWDNTCLTEDADIGIRLSRAKAKISIIYDERHVTKEETPPNVDSFVRQRTRWNHGFLQILLKGDWLHYDSIPKVILAFYVLSWPIMQSSMFLYLIISPIFIFLLKIPLTYAIVSVLPLLVLFLNLLISSIAMYEFTKQFRVPFVLWMPLKLFVTFLPYYVMLGISSLRAIVRILLHKGAWEKTPHINAHRTVKPRLGWSF